MALAALALLLLPPLVAASDNRLAQSPPMGWRSWNLFGSNVSQLRIERIMRAMAEREHLVDGVPTSLCDLGYCDVGLDDNWQLCGAYGAEGQLRFHDETGAPIVNTTRFPSLKAMTDLAHSLGLYAGWYGNNCICMETHTEAEKFYRGDVQALRAYGFDSIKLDGCGSQNDLELFDRLIKETPATSGREAVLVENCHWGSREPFAPHFAADGSLWCPWNFYRTSGDVRANYDSVVRNLLTTVDYARRNLSQPGCWAYPDMLEVGVACSEGGDCPGGTLDLGLNAAETRAHFGAWAIVSSPLILSHDVTDPAIAAAVWPVIANKEVIAVNQAWAGHSGSPFFESSEQVLLYTPPEWAYRRRGVLLLVACALCAAVYAFRRLAAARRRRRSTSTAEEEGHELGTLEPKRLVDEGQAIPATAPRLPLRVLLCLAFTAALVAGVAQLVYVWGEETLNPYHSWELLVPAAQYFYKPVRPHGEATAVLLMNHAPTRRDLRLEFAAIPGVLCTRCHVRDLWAHRDLGNFSHAYVASDVESHDAPFLLITPAAV
ncbi:hypothetical protein AB1Y20_004937 [Prymnesium parvum]|uniref:Alpha-galactosidase n=1 Tax=Prymnesium parvum TaxID=97485 RepID=A0AB34J4I3_PRYPA